MAAVEAIIAAISVIMAIVDGLGIAGDASQSAKYSQLQSKAKSVLEKINNGIGTRNSQIASLNNLWNSINQLVNGSFVDPYVKQRLQGKMAEAESRIATLNRQNTQAQNAYTAVQQQAATVPRSGLVGLWDTITGNGPIDQAIKEVNKNES